ncbi:hypothetical protein LD119_00712 [Mesoplasma sp. JKS002660]|uniref:hypothetical protein n=1 Tax=Mesoplasma whartonense TaxID=2878854 RepID=UPI002022B66B|nr:hypothetical protein [Mesoplasma sp. JKS002660]MCL8213761.1 hypothetical protein [Mesoplasma sp. JKS002660]
MNKATREKYRINESNCGFDWEVFIKAVPLPFIEWLLAPATERLAETARWTGKTDAMTNWYLFCFLNFTDWNGLVGRKDKLTHRQTTINTFLKVAKRLEVKFGITIGPENPYGIKWTIDDPNPSIEYQGRVIRFISIGKFSDQDLGMEFVNGGLGDVWSDEASKPSKDDVPSDNGLEIYQNASSIEGSAIRSDYQAPSEPIKDWKVEVPDTDNLGQVIDDLSGKEFTFYVDGVAKVRKLKTKLIYFYKRTRKTFTLNPWDPANYFHDHYFEDLWEKDYQTNSSLLNQNCVLRSFNDGQVILMRARAWMAKDGRYLSKRIEDHLHQIKKTNYAYYETVVNGEILESDDLSKYVFREDMKRLNFIDLNKTNYLGKLRIYPEYITIGVDWGWSKPKAKKTAVEVVGYFGKDTKMRAWEHEVYWDELSFVSKSNAVDDEQWKIEKAAEFIFQNWKKFQPQFKSVIYVWVDEADKAVANSLRQEIWRKHGIKIPFVLGAKHDSQNGWGVNSRTQFWKEILSSGRAFIDPKRTPLIYKELFQMMHSKDSFKRNPLCANDAITAIEYSRTKTRFFLKRSLIPHQLITAV